MYGYVINVKVNEINMNKNVCYDFDIWLIVWLMVFVDLFIISIGFVKRIYFMVI